MTNEQMKTTLDAVLATFALHVESRIAALAGHGFYTIGPCGEEALSSVGHALDEADSAALHYRHLGINLARNLASGVPMADLLKDRARGYVVSRHDPVTGGVHCSIGSRSGHDYIVTSTLASQCPPAVGRALGYAISPNNSQSNQRQISYVTIGDGSAHHSHFWSAFHLARHARHKRIKCPTVFGISDNGLSISYRTDGYCRTLFEQDPLVPLFHANGNDIMDVYDKTRQAVSYSRRNAAPSVLLYGGLTRRFGHAATDRQFAYLSNEQINDMANVQTIESTIMQVVEVYNIMSYAEVHDRLDEIHYMAVNAFDEASLEEKVTRQDMLNRVSPPALPLFSSSNSMEDGIAPVTFKPTGKKEVMRKHMTRVIDECLGQYPEVVYLGEDVEHGGYYLVTDGLAKKYKGRVMDFPPVSITGRSDSVIVQQYT
jgi:2-oxoisovalerate dehydrogenase E1 component